MFSIAVLLIVMVGGELFTGNNLVMAFGLLDKKVGWGDLGKVWVVSYIGNFVGCFILSLIFVGGGASGTADYFAGFIDGKLSIAPGQMFFRAVLCNFLSGCIVRPEDEIREWEVLDDRNLYLRICFERF